MPQPPPTPWPHKETPLADDEKQAYRYLLYMAMLDIRSLCQSRGPVSRNPLEWWRQYRASRVAGMLADWLHNLADYASREFQGFDAERFWREHDSMHKRSHEFRRGSHYNYREQYDKQLARNRSEV